MTCGAYSSILHRCQTELGLNGLRAKGKLLLGKCARLPWGAGAISHAHACATHFRHLPPPKAPVPPGGQSPLPVPWVQGCPLLCDHMGRSQEGPCRSARACLSLSSPSLPCDRGVCAPCFTPFHSHGSPG